jgi:hypothetical protein
MGVRQRATGNDFVFPSALTVFRTTHCFGSPFAFAVWKRRCDWRPYFLTRSPWWLVCPSLRLSRVLAWIFYFGVTPWILNRDRARFGRWVPRILRQYWFEWTTYSHYAVGWITMVATLYARFEVFFPIIVGWELLLYNNYREATLHTFDVEIKVGPVATDDHYALIHRSEIDSKPNAIGLVIPRPALFRFNAGQYIQILVGEVDPYWHCFSLASCPADEAIHLLIGIKGKTKVHRGPSHTPAQRPRLSSRRLYPPSPHARAFTSLALRGVLPLTHCPISSHAGWRCRRIQPDLPYLDLQTL